MGHVGFESRHRLGGGRQSGEIEGHPSDEGPGRCGGSGIEVGGFETGEDEEVDLVAGPIGVLDDGERDWLRGLERPMFEGVGRGSDGRAGGCGEGQGEKQARQEDGL